MEHKLLLRTKPGMRFNHFDLGVKLFLAVAIACLCWPPKVMAQPANDLCANAQVLPNPDIFVQFGGNTTDATTTGAPPNCVSDIDNSSSGGVWYRVTLTAGRGYEFSTCASATGFDTEISLFTGTCGALTCVGGNDNDISCNQGNTNSTFIIVPPTTQQYYLYLTGNGTATGFATIFIRNTGPAPSNDDCDNARHIPVPLGGTGTFSSFTSIGPPIDAPANCGIGVDNSEVGGLWYEFTGTGGLFYEITTCNSSTDFDTELSLYMGACGAFSCVDGNDDSGCSSAGGVGSTLFVNPSTTTQYYLYLNGDEGASGNFRLTVSNLTTPDNDLCGNAQQIIIPDGGVGFAFGTTKAATTNDAPANCSADVNNSDVGGTWYTFTGTGGLFYEVSTCDPTTTFDTEISVYSGTCGALSCVDGNDDDPSCIGSGSASTVAGINPSVNTQYYVYVKGNGGTSGDFGLSIVGQEIPDDPPCANPVAVCQDATVQFDPGGTAVVTPDLVDNGSTVNCGFPLLSVSPDMFDCTLRNSFTPLSGVVTLTVTDIEGKTSTCTANVTAEDNILPFASCRDLTLDLEDNHEVRINPFNVYKGDFEDNCWIPGISFELTQSRFRCEDVGVNVVTMTATSQQGSWVGGTATCTATITVEDNYMPYALCTDISVQLDENGEVEVAPEDVDGFDFGAGQFFNSFDFCGILPLELSPTQFDCTNLGDNTVTLLVTDVNENTAECIATVTVEGLPCGFTSNDDGIGCPDGSSVSYDLDNDVFTITSEGCYDPAYYSATDSHGFISTDLCGDGEIIAEVTNVSGNGWAGITMRETSLPGSKMMQLMIDGSFLTMRELRQSTGGIAFAHQFTTLGRNWLRLTRTGNIFGAYHSSDGINWEPVLKTMISMANCIEIGLVTANKTPTGTMTATFEHVSIIGGGPAPLLADNGMDLESQIILGHTFGLYPNPTNGEAFVNLQEYVGEKAMIRIFSATGQLLERIEIDEVQVPTQELNLSAYQDGLYLINLKVEGYQEVTKKLMLNRN